MRVNARSDIGTGVRRAVPPPKPTSKSTSKPTPKKPSPKPAPSKKPEKVVSYGHRVAVEKDVQPKTVSKPTPPPKSEPVVSHGHRVAIEKDVQSIPESKPVSSSKPELVIPYGHRVAVDKSNGSSIYESHKKVYQESSGTSLNVVINGVGEQVGEGILNAAVGGIIKGQAPNKNGNVLIYNKNWQSSLVKDKRTAIYAGIKGDAQDIDNGKKVWNFVGINVNDAAYSLSKSGYGVRSMADIQKLDESKESRALNNSLKNEKLKLTAKELAVIFRDDPEGVKGYLTAKNDEKLINDTFREITGEEPTYYLHMPLNGWEKTEDTKGDIISCVTSDAKELLINKPKGPRDMIDVIDTGFKIGAVCFGAAELSLIMEGVERFGVKNTITMYSHGKLAENVEYNKSISAQNGAVGSASTEGITTKGLGNASKSYLSPETEQKILGGERIPGKNGVRGGHSPNVVNDANDNYAVEVLKENPDGTKFVEFYHQFSDGTLSKLKKSTVFPDSWSDEKIISAIKQISDMPAVGSRTTDGITTTLHSGTVDGVEIDVIKEGNNITAGYPVGGKPTPGFEPIN